MHLRHLIVIGCSSGGTKALRELSASLPADLAAPVLIVKHVLPGVESMLPGILRSCGPLPAGQAADGEHLHAGRIYLAPPDRHLLVSGDRLRLSDAPRENRTRPAVDVLFRSAAAEHGRGVIGVILTGALDDGAAGLRAVHDAGGSTIVQQPDDAAYPGMPSAALRPHQPSFVRPLREIGPLLAELAGPANRRG